MALVELRTLQEGCSGGVEAREVDRRFRLPGAQQIAGSSSRGPYHRLPLRVCLAVRQITTATMKLSIIAVALLLANLNCLTGATKEIVKTRDGDVAFTLERWDDDDYPIPYRVYSEDRGVTAHHMFDSDGRLF